MSDESNLKVLNDFIVNCPDLAKLESMIGGFNIFQVLKFEYGEIRHSNVLAWLLNPDESHGLGELFLRRLLMRIVAECKGNKPVLTPVEIDGWRIREVEVRREWKHIDLFVIVTLEGGARRMICIENKVKARQHSGQLKRYREQIKTSYPDMDEAICILLSMDSEEPEDEQYITASYSQVRQVLLECLGMRRNAIGPEPMVLIQNYIRLLEEYFMNDSDIARTARQIYRQHKHALDILFEHRPDHILEVSEHLCDMIQRDKGILKVVPVASERRYIRFMPQEWDHPGNQHGNSVRDVPHSLVMEIHLGDRGDKSAYIAVSSWNNPESWSERIWELAGNEPFHDHKKSGKSKPWYRWLRLHREELGVRPDDSDDAEKIAQSIMDKVRAFISTGKYQQIVKVLADELPALEVAYKAIASQPSEGEA